MRRSRAVLLSLILGIAGLLGFTQAFAAPKRTATRPRIPNVNISRYNVNGSASNAALQASLRMAAYKRKAGTRIYVVQVRNPHWAKSYLMDPASAVVTRQILRRQGLSAHLHNLGDQGVFVHYGMVHWLNKGATISPNVANTAAAQFRALGLSARVVSRQI